MNLNVKDIVNQALAGEGTVMREVSFDPNAGMNLPDEIVLENVRANIRRQLPQVMPHQPNPNVALLVCGGPSLEESFPTLQEACWNGGKIIAVNGAYEWCISKGLMPSAFVMLDGREFNKRFVERPVPKCHYLLASQCHPATFEVCKDRKVTIWHTLSGGEPELNLLADYYFNRLNPVPTGTTVAIRAITLLRILGFMRQEIFGLDSCWSGNTHHAYSQPENDSDMRIPVTVKPTRGKETKDDMAHEFICAPWHVRQAEDFKLLTQQRGDLLQLRVHGNGLIATMVNTGAKLSLLTE